MHSSDTVGFQDPCILKRIFPNFYIAQILFRMALVMLLNYRFLDVIARKPHHRHFLFQIDSNWLISWTFSLALKSSICYQDHRSSIAWSHIQISFLNVGSLFNKDVVPLGAHTPLSTWHFAATISPPESSSDSSLSDLIWSSSV